MDVAGSADFARIKAQVLDLLARVPRGRLTTYAAIGDELDVPPRHVAYIVSALEAEERDGVPWHRVVAEDGALGAKGRTAEKATLLAGEGVALRGRRALDLQERFVYVRLDEEGPPRPLPPAPPAPARRAPSASPSGEST